MTFAIRALPDAFAKRMLTEIIAINANLTPIFSKRVMPRDVPNASVSVQQTDVQAQIFTQFKSWLWITTGK